MLVPANAGWTKSCRLFMRYASMRAFKLLEIPDPPPSDPIHGNRSYLADPGRTRTKSVGIYRIAYAPNPGSQKPHMARFRLSSGYTQATLLWLTDYLNSSGVDWMYLTNRFGNPLSRSAFWSTSS